MIMGQKNKKCKGLIGLKWSN